MKFPKNDEIEEYTKAISIGGLKGIVVGSILSVGAAAVLKRKTSFFNNIGGFQRNLLYVAPSLFCGMTSMELASRKFEEHKRDVMSGVVPIDSRSPEADFYDRAKDFLQENQYKFVVGGWAASMAGSFWYVNRDKYLTRSQKIVQARVYAQGATVAMLLLTVLLSVQFGESEDAKLAEAKANASNSWQRDLQYVSHEENSIARRAAAKAVKGTPALPKETAAPAASSAATEN